MGDLRIRPDIEALPTYKAGQWPPSGGYKLSSNENPYPPLASVSDVIAQAAAEVNRYPDPASAELVTAIARRFDVDVEQVALGTGSVAVCQQVVSSLAGPGDEVVFAWPSFEAYPIITGIAGATAVPVAVDDRWRHDIPAMIAAVTPATRCLFLCTPNNPTGTVISHDELTQVLAEVPPSVAVIADEAYVEFVDDPAVARPLELLADHPNLVVLRTFSKAYGLAGLRVGFGLAEPNLATALRKTSLPFGVSNIAHDAALASLAAEAELKQRVDTLVQRRADLAGELSAQGWDLAESQGNFLWLGTGDDTADIAAALTAQGIVVRPFPGAGLRVTVGEEEANAALVKALANLASPTNE